MLSFGLGEGDLQHSFPLKRRKGLLIGSLTSQLFTHVSKHGVDHFVKENLKAQTYLRYVNDFSLLADDHAFLEEARVAIADYLATLRLKLHPVKTQLFETQYGANFVGFRVLPDRIRVRNDNLRRSRLRLRRLQHEYRLGQVPLTKLIQRLQSWEAHLLHADTYCLRRQIFEHWVFTTSAEVSL